MTLPPSIPLRKLCHAFSGLRYFAATIGIFYVPHLCISNVLEIMVLEFHLIVYFYYCPMLSNST